MYNDIKVNNVIFENRVDFDRFIFIFIDFGKSREVFVNFLSVFVIRKRAYEYGKSYLVSEVLKYR